MQMNQVRDSVNRIEQCADDAIKAMKSTGSAAPDELRACVSRFHEQARDLREQAQQSADEQQLISSVDSLEQTADRAKQACRNAGSTIDPQLQSAVLRAHDEISGLKKQLH